MHRQLDSPSLTPTPLHLDTKLTALLALQYGEVSWTLWDRFELRGNPTLQSVVDYFQNEHKLEVTMVSQGAYHSSQGLILDERATSDSLPCSRYLGVSMLWSAFTPAKKASLLHADLCSLWELTFFPSFLQSQERLVMRMSDLVENVSKKPLGPVKNILVEVMVNDEEGEDVEVSSYRDVFLRSKLNRTECFFLPFLSGPFRSGPPLIRGTRPSALSNWKIHCPSIKVYSLPLSSADSAVVASIDHDQSSDFRASSFDQSRHLSQSPPFCAHSIRLTNSCTLMTSTPTFPCDSQSTGLSLTRV